MSKPISAIPTSKVVAGIPTHESKPTQEFGPPKTEKGGFTAGQGGMRFPQAVSAIDVKLEEKSANRFDNTGMPPPR